MYIKTDVQQDNITEHFNTLKTPCDIVIFGASGDLCHRKIIPALFHLHSVGEFPDNLSIIGFARKKMTPQEFIASLYKTTQEFAPNFTEELWASFSKRLQYFSGNYDDQQAFADFRDFLKGNKSCTGRLYYLATPPAIFRTIIASLHDADLLNDHEQDVFSRVIIEKPFGVDLDSALELNHFLHSKLQEKQIYRIDHYLGKNTVQNLLFFRFANSIFEPLWNRNQISHITITSTESIGVENRGGFYDSAGVIRDFIQNHLLQLLALIAMEQPSRFSAEEIRNEKVKVLRSLRTMAMDSYPVITGQYENYRAAEGVADDSNTPTFAAMRVMIDNWRWQGVPFYVIAGKKLAERKTECVIHFKQVPTCIFGDDNTCVNLQGNRLTFSIQPEEEIKLEFVCKSPGDKVEASSVLMEFNYEKAFDRKPLTAYERLILDALRGDATLFAREDETEAAWRYITPILLETAPRVPQIYRQNSDGPDIRSLFNHRY